MADPEARVVVTAHDATARAFASAQKNLGKLSRSVYQLRTVFAGFGVIVSGRMFANWIKDAIEVEKLTADQAIAIENASKAVSQLNSEFQNIARTAAASLAPALETAAKFWKEFFFPSGSQFGADRDALSEQINRTTAEFDRLQTLLNTQSNYNTNANWLQRMLFGDGAENVAATTAALAEARAELERLGEAWRAATGGEKTQIITQEEWVRLETFLYELNQKPPMITQDELVRLEEFIYALNQKPPLITPEEEQMINDLIAELNTPKAATPMLTQEEWVDLESFIYELNHAKDQSLEIAATIGEAFRESFTDWILGAERSFGDLLKRMAAELATSALFKSLSTTFGSGTMLGSFFGGFRAHGGPVEAGRGYVVGERGPELFMPGTSGMIAPAGGPSINIINNIDARGSDASVLARLPAILDANSRRTKAEIKDEMRRGRF